MLVLGFEKKFYFDVGDFDYIMIVQCVCLCIQCYIIDYWELFVFDVGNEVIMGLLGDDCYLEFWFVQCGQVFGQFEFFVDIGFVEQLDGCGWKVWCWWCWRIVNLGMGW